MLQPPGRERQFGETEMKLLFAALTLFVAFSQYACKPLVAGGVGAAVGVAAERERQEDKDDD
jgi:fructose-specific phosphotransferase system IIC component